MTVVSFDALLEAAAARNHAPEGVRQKLFDALLEAHAARQHAEWERGESPPPLAICITRLYAGCEEGDFTPEEVRLIAENPATARAVASCFRCMEDDELDDEMDDPRWPNMPV